MIMKRKTTLFLVLTFLLGLAGLGVTGYLAHLGSNLLAAGSFIASYGTLIGVALRHRRRLEAGVSPIEQPPRKQ